MEKRRAGHEIKILSNLLKRQLRAGEISECDQEITGMQGRILGYLCHNGDREIFQRDIEAEFLIRRSTATGILQLMERDGLIVRQPVARDARLKQLKLTQKAIAIHHKIEEQIDRMEDRLIQGILEEEMAVFYRVVDRMKENMEE